MVSETKTCQNCKQKFTIDPEDFDFYEKISVPPPTFCPDCRSQRRLAFRNERFMYKTKSAFSGKEIFSMHLPSSKAVVYENSAWFSDSWNAMDYGRDYDFSKPFFEQLLELYQKIPLFALSVVYGVNSDYSSNFTGFKNCYLCFNGNYSEDSAYSVGISYSKNCFDCSYIEKSENCYGCFWCNSCANCFYCTQCHNSYNLYFCKNCVGCNDCFGCVDLRNKKHHIFNQSYTKEDYDKFLADFNSGSRKTLDETRSKTKEHWMKYPMRYMEGLKNVNVSGEYIHNCKNVRNSFIMMDAENARYSSYAEMGPIKDCYDYTVWGNGAELVYEVTDCGLGINNVRFCLEVWPNMQNAEYSLYCQTSADIFGCVGLKNKKFCILNKQYPENEYKEMRAKIIKHMQEMPYQDRKGNIYDYGEFFPPSFSTHAYNKTMAQEIYPLEKEEAFKMGYLWEDLEEKQYQPTIKGSDLPNDISGANDNILKETVLCSSWEADSSAALKHNCSKAFRIIPMELQFYRRFKVPLPTKCHNCRHYERTLQKQPMKLWRRTCQCAGEKSENNIYQNTATHQHGAGKCPNEFETSYSPDRKEIVYCEQCYNSEVV